MLDNDETNHPTAPSTLSDTAYALYVNQKLARSLQVATEGNVISQEEMEVLYLDDTGREFLL
jgi:hypothetical protein